MDQLYRESMNLIRIIFSFYYTGGGGGGGGGGLVISCPVTNNHEIISCPVPKKKNT